MRYDAEALKEFSIQIMRRCGLSREESEIFSDSLIRADLRGISSHGLTRLTAYARRVELGLVSGHVTPEITRDGGGVIAVDGKNGMGAYVGRWTMEACVRRARKQGGCFAAVAHGNHFGYAAYFTEYAARQGMLGLAIANGPPPMPPTGGKTPLLGTNPLAVSLPTGDPDRPLTLDMATSAAARGKVTLAKKNGQSIPLGWGVDSQGNPTTDPEAVLSGGAMLPMGGPKGYAISLIIDVLCSCITGSADGQTMGSFYDFTRTQNSGYCFAALDLSRMVEPEGPGPAGHHAGVPPAARSGGHPDPRPAGAGEAGAKPPRGNRPLFGSRGGAPGAVGAAPGAPPRAPGRVSAADRPHLQNSFVDLERKCGWTFGVQWSKIKLPHRGPFHRSRRGVMMTSSPTSFSYASKRRDGAPVGAPSLSLSKNLRRIKSA